MTLPLFGKQSVYSFKDVMDDYELHMISSFFNKDLEVDEARDLVEEYLKKKLDIAQFIGSKAENVLFHYKGNGWFSLNKWQPFEDGVILQRLRGKSFSPSVDDNGNLVFNGDISYVQTLETFESGVKFGNLMHNKERFEHFLKIRSPINTLYNLGVFEAGKNKFGLENEDE